jgi:predicted nucleotidyltransferase
MKHHEKDALILGAKELCRENNASLLFLTLFGSSLYGTETPGRSDVDARGIFLPSPESLALNSASGSLHYSTGSGESRNTASDVDMDLWSIQHWLLKLLPSGDTGALDLLFSPSHEACTLFRDARLDAVFANPLKLLDAKNSRAYAEYSIGQAKKYGIKGSRIGALKNVHKWLLANCPVPAPGARLRDILGPLAAECADGRFCSAKTVQDEPSLQLCGKIHVGGIRIAEFIRRVDTDMRRYGARAVEAEQNQGIDFKALSHALRALDQMEELLKSGGIIFPLRNREELIAVKTGAFTWAELEPKILDRLSAVDALRNSPGFTGYFDRQFAERQILACYGHGGPRPEIAATVRNAFQKGFEVPAATLDAIHHRLDATEAAHRVKILFACESGSRGWGFASGDSDFDVRFIYAHDPDWYLGVAPEEKRDVLESGIEETPAGVLDISGWELRKALKQFRRSNPTLHGWLFSPLIYRESGPLASLLRTAAPAGALPLKTWHHYRGMLEKSRARYCEKPSIKGFFYVLRSLLAMRWTEMGKGLVPMRFDLLMDGVIGDRALREDLDALVAVKKTGREKDECPLPPRIAAYVGDELKRLPVAPAALSPEGEKTDLDSVFRLVLRQAWGTAAR